MVEPFYIPEGAVQPQDVRITELKAEPYPDGRRVHILIALTPFLKRPNLSVSILDPSGETIASVNVIEAMTPRMTFTMHIRGPQVSGACQLTVDLNYPDPGTVDQSSVSFELTPTPPDL